MIVATPMPPTGVRTPFESIQSQFGPAEAAVIAHMRRVLKVGSFALSRERGTARATKHAYLRRSGFNCAYLPDAAQALMALQEPERAMRARSMRAHSDAIACSVWVERLLLGLCTVAEHRKIARHWSICAMDLSLGAA